MFLIKEVGFLQKFKDMQMLICANDHLLSRQIVVDKNPSPERSFP